MVQITQIHLVGGNRHEHIASVMWRNPQDNGTGENTRSEMVAWLNTPGAQAVVITATRTVEVGVVDANPPYIRTHADGVWTDNLLALPQY